jgi:phosphate transport system ATP-binding protein
MVTAETTTSVTDVTQNPVKLGVKDLHISYNGVTAIKGVNFDIHEHEIFGIIGPANAGKTSFLKAVNRMDMFTPEMKVE